jgi:hypothetical protein
MQSTHRVITDVVILCTNMVAAKNYKKELLKLISGIVLTGTFLFLILASPSTLLPKAEATMLSQDIITYTLKGQPTMMQLSGSANYSTFHYEIAVQPLNGKIVMLDAKSGQLVYKPNSDFTGIDSLRYRIVSNYNETWSSNTATGKVAVVEPWKQYCYNSQITPIQLSQYIKAKQLTAANMPGIMGTTNIEPLKATPQGHMEYVDAKAAFEVANGSYSWWTLNLEQKAWIMDNYCNLLDRTDLWLNPQR